MTHLYWLLLVLKEKYSFMNDCIALEYMLNFFLFAVCHFMFFSAQQINTLLLCLFIPILVSFPHFNFLA